MAEQTYNENGNGISVVSGPAIVEKDKFIIVCGGRGLGEHNNGRNFLNTAKYHIEDIVSNSYPLLPKFDSATCEIITPENVYQKVGYFKHTDPQKDGEYKEDREGYILDSQNRRIDQFNNENIAESERDYNWYVLNPRDLENFLEPLVLSQPTKKNDPLFMKAVEKGELQRVSDFKKIFSLYKNIKYIAYFGHGWSGDFDGTLLIGDRAANDTNMLFEDLYNLDITNVLPDAQIRLFSCRSGYKENKYLCAAEMFAKKLQGRKVYGWAAKGGSIFTHDESYGRTGMNTTGKDANTAIVDSNKKKTWLVANGKPQGWKEYVF